MTRAAGGLELGEQLAGRPSSIASRTPMRARPVAVRRGVGAELEGPEHGLVVGEETHADVDRSAPPGAVAVADSRRARTRKAVGWWTTVDRTARAASFINASAPSRSPRRTRSSAAKRFARNASVRQPSASRTVALAARSSASSIVGSSTARVPEQHRPGERRPCRTTPVLEGVDAALGRVDRTGRRPHPRGALRRRRAGSRPDRARSPPHRTRRRPGRPSPAPRPAGWPGGAPGRDRAGAIGPSVPRSRSCGSTPRRARRTRRPPGSRRRTPRCRRGSARRPPAAASDRAARPAARP